MWDRLLSFPKRLRRSESGLQQRWDKMRFLSRLAEWGGEVELSKRMDDGEYLGDYGDDCVRDGHQQARCEVRLPLLCFEKYWKLLPGKWEGRYLILTKVGMANSRSVFSIFPKRITTSISTKFPPMRWVRWSTRINNWTICCKCSNTQPIGSTAGNSS